MDGDEEPHVIYDQNRTAYLGDRDGPPHQTARRSGAQRNHERGMHNLSLQVVPPAATVDLVRIRPLVQPPLAARLEFEMFTALVTKIS
jgi:hypothetical protein